MSRRFSLLVLAAAVWAAAWRPNSAIAQPPAAPFPRSSDVTATSAANSFADRYVFGEGSGLLVLTGTLTTGGVETPITVMRQVPETQTRTVDRYKIVYRNGRPEVVVVVVTQEFTVYKPVYETVILVSPAVTGAWYAVDFDAGSWWAFYQPEATGLAVGVGTTAGANLSGAALYFNFQGVPSGYYFLRGSAASASPVN